MSENNRIRISLTGRVEQMVQWFLNNDPAYQGARRRDVIEMLLERGAEAVYLEGLRNAEPLDPALEEELSKLSVAELTDALVE